MATKPVLESLRPLLDDLRHVRINDDKVEEVAKEWAQRELVLPDWKLPAYIDGSDEEVMEYFLLANSINFAFTDFETGEKYLCERAGIPWKGSTGMWAALANAHDARQPILEGAYLRDAPERELRDIFGESIPMLDERIAILREVGTVLTTKYGGRFRNVVEGTDSAFGEEGLVTRLARDFPSFDDSAFYRDHRLCFYKRAQLAAGMLHARMHRTGTYALKDVDRLTIFADYNVDRTLRHLGVQEVDDALQQMLDNRLLLTPGSRPVNELRASAIDGADRIVKKANEILGGESIHALHADYFLWSEGRKLTAPHMMYKGIEF